MIILSKRWSKKWVFSMLSETRSITSRTALIVIIINKARSSCVLLGIGTNVKLRPRSFGWHVLGKHYHCFHGEINSLLLRKVFSVPQSFPKSLPISSTWPIKTCICIQDLKACLFQRVFWKMEYNTNIILMYAIQRGPPLENKVGRTMSDLKFLVFSAWVAIF